MSWSKWWPTAQYQPSRRAFLGGSAAAIALPFLPSLLPRSARAADGAPVRLLFYYVPNGMHMNEWRPDQTGAGYDLKRILAPIAPYQSDVSVITGLANRAASVPVAGDHARGTGSFLTCQTVALTSGDDIQNGISVDQVAAQAIGGQTLFPSLELGVAGGTNIGSCDSGYSCAYSRNISWSGPSTPMPKTTRPDLVFDRLFSGFDLDMTQEDIDRRQRWRASVLDSVTGEANSLRTRLGRDDQYKLDEYLTGIRQLETRIQNAAGECVPGTRPGADLPYELHIEVMNELMVKAFECDMTRVASFMMENAGSYRSFDFIGVTGAHHELSHHQGDVAKHESLVAIDTWEVERFAHLLDLLSTTTDIDGNRLLDNTLVLFSSEISDGDRHNHDDLPVLLAGGGGGAHNAGRHIDLGTETPIANLFVSMLQAAGVNAQSFGMDSTGPLSEIG